MKARCVLVLFLFHLTYAHGVEQTCPKGQFTKDAPSKEDGLATCKYFSCNSCCSPEITKQLALVPLQQVGAINYTQCGTLSDMCSYYMSYIQCFYQCSPNIYVWTNPSTKVVENLPICGSFCDNWFEACSADMTCTRNKNWMNGFTTKLNADGTKAQQCFPGESCRNYSVVYASGQDMCNNMWGHALQYTSDKDGGDHCVDPSDMQHNADFIKETKGDEYPVSVCGAGEYVDTGLIIGIVVGVIAGIALILALVALIRSRKFQKKEDTGGKAAPKEMEELNPTPEA